MSMCRVISCVVGRGCLLWSVSSLSKTLWTFLYPKVKLVVIMYPKVKCACYSRYLLSSYSCFLIPLMLRTLFCVCSFILENLINLHQIRSDQITHSVMSDSSRPHGLQPTRLLHPWDFPGNSTGVGCHCLLPHYRGLECKSRKSRNAWSNRQIWLWSTEWSRAKANRVLPRECTGQSKHRLPTTQEKTLHMDITRWSTPKSDWLYSLQPKIEKLYTVSKNMTGSWLARIMNSLFPNSDLNWRK